MSEIKTEVKVFRVELKCDTCKKGTMICIVSHKPAEGDRRKHVCSNDDCQVIRWIPKLIYPRIEYQGATIPEQLASIGRSTKEKLKAVLSTKPPVKNPKQKPNSKK